MRTDIVRLQYLKLIPLCYRAFQRDRRTDMARNTLDVLKHICSYQCFILTFLQVYPCHKKPNPREENTYKIIFSKLRTLSRQHCLPPL